MRGAGRGARVPLEGLGGLGDHVAQARVAQVAQAESDGIGFGARGQLVHEGFVGESILQARGRTQRRGVERRRHVVEQRALRLDGAGAARLRRRPRRRNRTGTELLPLSILHGIGRGRARQRRPQAQSPSRVPLTTLPGCVVAGAVAEDGGPGFVVPGDDVALGVEGGALVHDEGQAVIFAPGRARPCG